MTARSVYEVGAQERAGISLTESFAMHPASSVSGLYFAHPEAKYFAVGPIGEDHVIDYHLRKDVRLGLIERWLGPNLTYLPPADDGKCRCGREHANLTISRRRYDRHRHDAHGICGRVHTFG